MTVSAVPKLSKGWSSEFVPEPITTTQLVKYAGASGDFNRIHYDQAYAVEAGLGGIVAHGMLTMAFMAQAVARLIGDEGRVYSLSARFTSPVRPGDVVKVQTLMGDVISDEYGFSAQISVRAFVADQVVAIGSAVTKHSSLSKAFEE